MGEPPPVHRTARLFSLHGLTLGDPSPCLASPVVSARDSAPAPLPLEEGTRSRSVLCPVEDAGDLATLVASAAGASIAWEGVKVPLWEDSVEVVEGFVVLGLVAKEALATATVFFATKTHLGSEDVLLPSALIR